MAQRQWILFVSLILAISVNDCLGETYLSFENRINSIQYRTQKDETLENILTKYGYQNLYGQYGAINQTLWKNGIRKDDFKLIPKGMELRLPYDPSILRKKNGDDKLSQQLVKPLSQIDFGAVSIFLSNSFMSSQSKDSNNNQGQTDTKLHQFLQLEYDQFWEKNWRVQFKLGSHKIVLDTPSEGTLSNKNFNILSYGLEVERKISKNWYVPVSYNLSPIISVDTSTSSTIDTNIISLSELAFGARRSLFKYKKLSSDLKLSILSVLPQHYSSFKYKNSWGYEGVFSSQYRHQNWAIKGRFYYKSKNLQRDISIDNQVEMGVLIGASIYLN